MGSQGKCVTVLGEVCPSSLGRTLTHEHLSMQFEVVYQPPKHDVKQSLLPWNLRNSGWIRQNPYSHHDNLFLNDSASESAILESVRRFADLGGGCIVENSTCGLDRKTQFLRRVAMDTGIHVIAGTGYYVGPAQTEATKALSIEAMASHMVKELTEGCSDEADIKCGFIGEIGCSFPLQDVEKKAILASAEAQEMVKCCVSFHPGRHPSCPEEILRIFMEAGGNDRKSIMSHMEKVEKKAIRGSAAAQESVGCAVSFHPGRHHSCPEEIMRIFMEAGGRSAQSIMSHVERTLVKDCQLLDLASFCDVNLQFDLFGTENSYYQLEERIDFPSDAQRMDQIVTLIEEGYSERILISHDIHTKHRFEAFGGHGFAHILENVVPKMINVKGISQENVDKILIDNPASVLQLSIG